MRTIGTVIVSIGVGISGIVYAWKRKQMAKQQMQMLQQQQPMQAAAVIVNPITPYPPVPAAQPPSYVWR